MFLDDIFRKRKWPHFDIQLYDVVLSINYD